jgi:hypothetical protein
MKMKQIVQLPEIDGLKVLSGHAYQEYTAIVFEDDKAIVFCDKGRSANSCGLSLDNVKRLSLVVLEQLHIVES